MISLVAGSVEQYLNALLEESTAARERLAALAGASLAVHLTVPGIELVVRAEEQALRVSPESARDTDAVISGTPLALFALWRTGRVSDFGANGVTLSGDAQTLERFVGLLRLLLPDGEEVLARVTGDLSAHELARVGQATRAWVARAADALLLDAAEYLQEESRDLPARAEAEDFFRDVERLRDDVARAIARMDRIATAARRSQAASEAGS
ncbi:MAG TPA: SCP2 sterol-binding domain-containing protein [Gammaproteobacteria bacterium]|nr:SCP2 sterol-binding domain-containing protein [Gammaproteobacteria bacterium]